VKEKWQHIFKNDDCPAIKDLMLYNEGKLPPDQRFILEHHLTGCDICNDILEGISSVDDPGDIDKSENIIKARIRNLLSINQKKSLVFPLYGKLAIAASILLLITSGILLYYRNQNKQLLYTQKTEELREKRFFKTDTVTLLAEKSISKSKPSSISVPASGAQQRTNTIENAPEAKTLSPSQDIPGEQKTQALDEVQPRTIELEKKSPESLIIKHEEPSQFINRSSDVKTQKIQKITLVSGRVLAEDGSPLPGATVQIKGTTNGTVSDLEGKYKLEVPDSNATLSFAYVGYLGAEIPVKSDKNVDIKLTANISSLDEVVVVGYGTQKKEETNGAVSTLTTEQINKLPITWNNPSNSNSGETQRSNKQKKSAESQNQKLLIQIDSLRKILQINEQDWNSRLVLIEKYLDLKNQPEAQKELEILKNQTTDSIQINSIQKIIHFTQEAKYKNALEALDKMK
jgi:hypothetical protein